MLLSLPFKKRSPLKLLMVTLIAATMAVFSGGKVEAAASVSWTNPANNSAFPVGTPAMPMGTASGVGVTGSGLDLVLVLDSSGSMGRFEAGQTLQQWQRDAAIALVNSLPTGTTSVSIVEFDSFASVVTGLTPLLPVGNIAAINGVNASGGTTIGSGITAAQTVLTGATATAGRSGQMVVLSDGFSSSPAA